MDAFDDDAVLLREHLDDATLLAAVSAAVSAASNSSAGVGVDASAEQGNHLRRDASKRSS